MSAKKMPIHFRLSDIETLVDIKHGEGDNLIFSFRRTIKTLPTEISFTLDAADAIIDRLQQLTISARGKRTSIDELDFFSYH